MPLYIALSTKESNDQFPHFSTKEGKQGVCHNVTLPFTLKSIFKYFTMQNIIFQNSFKRNQNPSRYYNYITNFKFQPKPKYHLSKKSSYRNRPITKILSATILYNEYEHNILANQVKANKTNKK